MGFSDLGKKLSKLGQDTKNGVQKVSDSVTISNRISQEKKSLERLFAMIGEAVYKESPNAPKAGLEDEWAAVKVAYANIAAYTEQLNHVKGLIYCPNCGRPAATGDKFCAKCGFRLNVRPETTGEKMAKDLKEAGQEAVRIAGDAADKTGEAVGGAAAGTKNAFSWLKEKLGKKKKSTDETVPEDAGKSAEGETTAAAEFPEKETAEIEAEETAAAERETVETAAAEEIAAPMGETIETEAAEEMAAAERETVETAAAEETAEFSGETKEDAEAGFFSEETGETEFAETAETFVEEIPEEEITEEAEAFAEEAPEEEKTEEAETFAEVTTEE